MEDLILGEFEKQNSKTGEILMLRNLQHGLMKNLNPKQQDDFNSAINSLIEKGLVTYEDETSGPACLRQQNKDLKTCTKITLISNKLKI